MSVLKIETNDGLHETTEGEQDSIVCQNWNTRRVLKWLENECKLSKYKELFKDIDGKILAILIKLERKNMHEELKEMGIDVYSDRLTIVTQLELFKL